MSAEIEAAYLEGARIAKEAIKVFAGDPEYLTLVARLMSNLVRALEAEGFTREEAISITSNWKMAQS